MGLSPGTCLGAYEIGSLLGSGGMGEVYRATDTHLRRDVAIKVLPEAVAHEPERLARFEREARMLATLNHPNVAAVYGLEKSAGLHAIVMELVEGPTLADRIAHGPIPFDEALAIARQIADGLEAAHLQGVVHRDLKPANIKLRDDGTVKILDFGLAKLTDSSAGSSQLSSPMLSQSPTMTTPAMTQLGMILGTAAYMSPEQARGRAADKRADIWAYGCVVYEMLTGKRAFSGEEVSDTLAAVLRADPDWTALPSTVPPAVATALRRCLEKDPKRRLHDIADVTILSEEIASLPAVQPDAAIRSNMRLAVQAGVAAALVVVGATAAWLAMRAGARPVPGRVERFEIVTPRSAPFTTTVPGRNLAVSPDGSQMVYHVQAGGQFQLALRRLDGLEPSLLSGTAFRGVPRYPTFSPDGTELAFFNIPSRKLVKIALSGGPVVPLCDLSDDPTGLSWGSDNVIVFSERNTGIVRIPATGGKPEKVASPDRKNGESDYSAPEILPGGQAVLFTVMPTEGTASQSRLVVRSLTASATNTTLVEGAAAGHYVPTGHIVYAQGGNLMAAAFDIASHSIKSPAAVQQRITVKSARGDVSADYSMGLDGSLVFAPTALSETQRLIWVDRSGKILSPLTDQPLQNPRYPRISPDGRRLAVTIGPSNEGQIWLYDLASSNQPLKLTFKGHNTQPTWAPNGRHIAFSSTILGPRNLFRLPADASSLEPERLTTNANVQIPLSWSPSGDDLLFREVSARTRDDIWVLPMTGNREPRPWLPLTEFADDEATFAPNGRWVAYVTDQTGQPEVWIRPFPGPGSPTRVSPSGGHDPIWARNGRELFYQIDGKLMAADVTATESQLQVKAPRMLFQGGFQPYAAGLPATYDVAPDGRFLMIESNDSAPASIVIVKNWLEELKRLVPVR